MRHKCDKCGLWLDNSMLDWHKGTKLPAFTCKDTTLCERRLEVCGKDQRDYFEYSHGYRRGLRKKKSFRDAFITFV